MRLLALLTALTIGSVAMCAPPKANAAYALSGDEAVSIICAYDWDCPTALAIAWRESRWQPAAVNPYSGAAGLMQIHPVHGYPIATLQDPYQNVAIAFALYEASGWAPWRVNQ